MKKHFLVQIFVGCLLLTSCISQDNTNKDVQKEIILEEGQTRKIERLKHCSVDSLIEYYDLSNDSIKEFPNLSKYRIRSLNLSYNQLDTIIWEYIPQDLVSLNLSHNKLKGVLSLELPKEESLSFDEIRNQYLNLKIKSLDLSYNAINSFLTPFYLRRFNISHNKLNYLYLNCFEMEYLNISYNPHLGNTLDFSTSSVNTIVRDGITNDKSLKFRSPEINQIICTIELPRTNKIK